MLKDLCYYTVEPDDMMKIIAQLNGVDIYKKNSYFEHYETGVYRHDGYIFNFENFIDSRCLNNVLNRRVANGVCDNYHQITEKYKEILSNPEKNYVIGLSTVKRENQSEDGGWRWHKWGSYIGTQNPQHEYLYDDKHIDKVFCFHIYEIE